MNNKKQLIFPINVGEARIYNGLTKRDYFAGLAMQGMVANSAIMEALTSSELIKGSGAEKIAMVSVEYADALLTELEKSANNE